MDAQNPLSIVILLSLAVAFVYLHMTSGSGLIRLLLAGAIALASIILLLPSFNLPLPGFLDSLPKIQLGLDLQGGTHLLLEVKLEDAVTNALRRRGDDINRVLEDNKLAPAGFSLDHDGSLLIKLKNADQRSAFTDLVEKNFPELSLSTVPNTTGVVFKAVFTQREALQVRSSAMDQALETIRNRIDQLGVRETTVVREGDNDILVQLPGIQDPEQAKELIGKTAVLEFKLLDDNHSVSEAVTRRSAARRRNSLWAAAGRRSRALPGAIAGVADRRHRYRRARAARRTPRGSVCHG